jgi:hypothetical protein
MLYGNNNTIKNQKQALTSLHKNSRILDLKTFRPSAVLENGVFPAPLSCISHLSQLWFKTSPKYLTQEIVEVKTK